MFKTKITEMLGLKYPLIGGTMAWISNAEFVAAMSQAGGMGVLASANYHSQEELAAALDRIRELTDKPFGVNINLFPSMRPVDNNAYLDVLVDKGVKIVETSGHFAPEDLCRRFKEAGMAWIHKCVGVRYALKAQSLGADIVTVVGYENGGATGKLDIGTMVLIPRVVESVKVPVIGGGGISDGRGLLAALALGAEGVIMGTRLLTTKEAPLHDNIKEALLEASELDTRLVMRSIGSTHRVWANAAADKCLELEAQGADLGQILKVVAGEKAKEMYATGQIDAGMLACGQGVGLAHQILTIKELFESIVAQADRIAQRLAGGGGGD
ncbi:MAG: nitronate monooxygenase [Deltaproteobacteria bacterium]|nr:nitronate monooxygenase [Deltaproteobacteria bacterium]